MIRADCETGMESKLNWFKILRNLKYLENISAYTFLHIDFNVMTYHLSLTNVKINFDVLDTIYNWIRYFLGLLKCKLEM